MARDMEKSHNSRYLWTQFVVRWASSYDSIWYLCAQTVLYMDMTAYDCWKLVRDASKMKWKNIGICGSESADAIRQVVTQL